MDLERVLDHLDVIAGAPGGVSRVRDLILRLAVQGRLVPQSPGEEPVTTSEVTINQDMKALLLKESRLGDFVLLALRGSKHRILDNVERSTHGTCRMPSSSLTDFVVGVPPLDEQRRVVARNEELMTLCEQLEHRIDDRRALAERLASAAVEAF